VHGADKFKNPVIIDDNVLKCIKENSKIAPLHNPPAIKGIEAVKKNFPDIIQVAVFDTSFHQTMPEKAYIYGLPYELYEKYNLRKYGFHGTSHKFVALQAAKKAKKSLENLKIITCHLGNGCSITAVKDGKSIDTSMGFTPLEGLLMGTRCGDIDPAIVYFLMEKEKFDTAEIDALLNKKSGLLGVSGISNDVRQVEDASKKGNKRAKLALDLYIYKISKYIGSYYAIMEGLDIVVFTAGVGENQENIRNQVISQVKHILDKEQAEVMVIPTNEELMIAKETEEVLRFANK
jgi:acetate kinase